MSSNSLLYYVFIPVLIVSVCLPLTFLALHFWDNKKSGGDNESDK